MKRCYQSRYVQDKLVTAAQYITELICEKKAKVNGGELPQQFWKLSHWAYFFKQQVNIANKLLANYSAQAIIRALNNPKSWNIYSLMAPHLYPIIQEEQRVIDRLEKNKEKATPLKVASPLSQPRQLRKKTSLLNTLDNIDTKDIIDGEKEK